MLLRCAGFPVCDVYYSTNECLRNTVMVLVVRLEVLELRATGILLVGVVVSMGEKNAAVQLLCTVSPPRMRRRHRA